MDRTVTNASVTAASAALFAASWVAIIHADQAAVAASAGPGQASTEQAGIPQLPAAGTSAQGGQLAATGQLVPAPAAPARVQPAPIRRSRAS